MKEERILHDTSHGYWVSLEKEGYFVWRPSASGTHSILDSAYAKTDDGLSIAQARANYLDRTHVKGRKS